MNVRNFKQAAVVASNLRKVLPASSHFQGLNCVRIPYTRYLIQMCESNKRSYVTTPLSNPVLDVPVLREHALDIFNTAVNAVLPQSMVTRALQLEGNVLTVNGQSYELKHNVHIVAFGKAVIGMVRAAEDVLGDHIVGGIASVPHGIQDTLRNLGKWDLLPSSSSRVKIMEGAENNIPDEDAHKAAMEIHSLLEKLTEDDIVLALFSGGGSALLPAPVPPITLSEMAEVTKILSLKGATIQQLNTVRKHLELLKGGGLARTAFPARVVSLIMSDVIENNLDFIASGPTTHSMSSPKRCLDLIHSLKIYDVIPQSVLSHLQERAVGSDNVGYGWNCLNAQNEIIGSNVIALDAAYQKAIQLGYAPFILSHSLEGDGRELGVTFGRIANFICRSIMSKDGITDRALVGTELELVKSGIAKTVINDLKTLAREGGNTDRPLCILGAGETTIQVKGDGKGGRNQEMALAAALVMDEHIKEVGLTEHCTVTFMSAGTDGQDGPTDAAGALADPDLISLAKKQKIDAGEFIERNDTYNFFRQVKDGAYHVITGLSGTNVMDIEVLLIRPNSWRTSVRGF